MKRTLVILLAMAFALVLVKAVQAQLRDDQEEDASYFDRSKRAAQQRNQAPRVAPITPAAPAVSAAPAGPAALPPSFPQAGTSGSAAAAAPGAGAFNFANQTAPGLVQDVTSLIPHQVILLTGQRVTDKISGRLLDDVYYEQIPEDMLGTLDPPANDKGEWPDLLADDGIYSNFTETNDFLSPESNQAKKQIIRLIEVAEAMKPLEFFLVPVAAGTPFSSLPEYMSMEEEHDNKIAEWNLKFLREFRKNPNAADSDFWPLYVPRPPLKPKYPPPEGFNAFILEPVATPGPGEAPGAAPGTAGAVGGNYYKLRATNAAAAANRSQSRRGHSLAGYQED